MDTQINIYKLQQDLSYYYLQDNEGMYFPSFGFCGEKLQDSWKSINLKYVTYDSDFGTYLKKSDFYVSQYTPVFTEKSKALLSKLIVPHGEILPFSCDDDSLFAFNTLTLCPILDSTKSNIKYFKDGDIMMILKYAFFLKDLPAHTHIFKLTDEPYGSVFVTQHFVDEVKKNDLNGFRFKQVN